MWDGRMVVNDELEEYGRKLVLSILKRYLSICQGWLKSLMQHLQNARRSSNHESLKLSAVKDNNWNNC
jgi:hypothetical protein